MNDYLSTGNQEFGNLPIYTAYVGLLKSKNSDQKASSPFSAEFTSGHHLPAEILSPGHRRSSGPCKPSLRFEKWFLDDRLHLWVECFAKCRNFLTQESPFRRISNRPRIPFAHQQASRDMIPHWFLLVFFGGGRFSQSAVRVWHQFFPFPPECHPQGNKAGFTKGHFTSTRGGIGVIPLAGDQAWSFSHQSIQHVPFN